MSVSSVQQKTPKAMPETSKAASHASRAATEPAKASAHNAVHSNAVHTAAASRSGTGTSRTGMSTKDEFVSAPAKAQNQASLPGLGLVQDLIKKGLSAVSKGDNVAIGLIRSQLNFLLGPGSTGQPGWMQRDKSLPPTKDVTSNFKDVYAQAAAGKNTLPPDAKKYVYLTVDGLTGNHWPGYMEPTRQGLQAQGLDARAIPIGTEDSTQTNADKIRQAILDASKGGKQVVLIGHSKGGLDIEAALSEYPELKSHVRAVVAMQSPFAGAPMATDLLSNPLTNAGVGFLAKDILGGSKDSVVDLTYKFRQDFMKAHPPVTDIPTLSLATSDNSQISMLAGANDYTKLRYGVNSDGLVVQQDAELPGSEVVKLDNMDHMQSVMPWAPGDNYDPKALSVALVSMALAIPQKQSSQAAA